MERDFELDRPRMRREASQRLLKEAEETLETYPESNQVKSNLKKWNIRQKLSRVAF